MNIRRQWTFSFEWNIDEGIRQLLATIIALGVVVFLIPDTSDLVKVIVVSLISGTRFYIKWTPRKREPRPAEEDAP